jgi:hypothetical protein
MGECNERFPFLELEFRMLIHMLQVAALATKNLQLRPRPHHIKRPLVRLVDIVTQSAKLISVPNAAHN